MSQFLWGFAIVPDASQIECRLLNVTNSFELVNALTTTMESTFGGTAELGNCVVLCRSCHRAITSRQAGKIAKSSRQRAAHIGAKTSRSPLPFGKRSRWKKKLDGTIVEP